MQRRCMTLMDRLLSYLSPDPADIGSIALMLYGGETAKQRRNAACMIRNLRRNGWRIDIAAGGYKLAWDQWQIVRAGNLLAVPFEQSITPESVAKTIPSAQSV